MICEACDEECEELFESDGMNVCEPCRDHFEADDAMRDEELRQMNEAFDAEFGDDDES